MERRAQRLAEQIRTTRDAGQRTRLHRDLARLLDDIFELKNRNRLTEARRFEDELDRLRATLAERERKKTEIIEAWTRQLVGPEP